MWAVFWVKPFFVQAHPPLCQVCTAGLMQRLDTCNHVDVYGCPEPVSELFSSRPTLTTLTFLYSAALWNTPRLVCIDRPRVLDKPPLCIVTKTIKGKKEINLSELFILHCLIYTSPGWKEESLFLVFSCVSPASPYDHHYVTKQGEWYSIVNSTVLSFSVIKYKYPGGQDACTDCVLLFRLPD